MPIPVRKSVTESSYGIVREKFTAFPSRGVPGQLFSQLFEARIAKINKTYIIHIDV